MACFLVPTTEAIVTTIVKKSTKNKVADEEGAEKHPFLKRLNRLNNMLWGGSALLAFEHIWHGEVVPWFPFLTNAASPESAAEMLREMAVSGVGMAVLVTAVWIATVAIEGVMSRRPDAVPAAESGSDGK